MAKFVRKNPDTIGTYHLAYKVRDDENGHAQITQEIKITGREVFETDDKKLIEFLKNDPEIEEVNKKTTIEGESNE